MTRPAQGTPSRLLVCLLLVMLLMVVVVAGCGRGSDDPAAGGNGGGGAPSQTPGDDEPTGPPPFFPDLKPGQVHHPLTGLPVDTKELDRPYSLVAIGNNPGARPQSGLPAADLVYEVPAEGGITRLLALFRAGRADPIGPVRSSRTYILDLAREWQAVLVHVGGSPGHYEAVGKSGVKVFDDRGASGSGVFWRASSRRAPDNLYTNTVRLRQKIEGQGLKAPAPERQPFRFVTPDRLPAGEEARELVIRRPGAGGEVVYRYDDEKYRYERYLGTKPHTDRESEEPLTATSLLIQFVPVRAIPGDTEGRLDVNWVSEGRLIIATGGTVREGKWRKDQRTAPTAFLEAGGGPATLLPGQVWILVVPTNTEVSFGVGSGEQSPES